MNLHAEWLKTPTGQALLAQEHSLVRSVLQKIFGDHLLQIGSWGDAGLFLDSARTRHQALVDTGSEPQTGVQALVSHQHLAISTDSVDAVFLPHTLELSEEPHAVLREVHRILRPDGRLVVLGFNPMSLWGLRHQFAGQGYPPGVIRHISRRRMTDWLNLLSLSVDNISPVILPASSAGRNNILRKLTSSRPAYMVVATKETIPVNHVRPRVRRRARLVRGLVNPTTRNVA